MAEEQPLNQYKPLREFLDDAHHNTKATEQNINELFHKLDLINKKYSELIGLLNYSKEWFLIFFVMRSHSSLLAGSTLATSAQLPDSYGAMRSLLENTLYAFYLWKHKDLIETWLRRQEDKEAKKRVRDSFKHGKMLAELKNINKKYGEIYEQIYEDSIDLGAHPNVHSILANIERIDKDKTIIHRLKYFNPDSPIIDLSIKRLCQSGVISIKIYGIIWSHRLKLTNFFQELEEIEKGL